MDEPRNDALDAVLDLLAQRTKELHAAEDRLDAMEVELSPFRRVGGECSGCGASPGVLPPLRPAQKKRRKRG